MPVGERFFAPVQNGPGAHTASCIMNNGSLFQRKSGRGVTLTNHAHLAPNLKKDLRYTSTPPLGLRGFSLGMLWSP